MYLHRLIKVILLIFVVEVAQCYNVNKRFNKILEWIQNEKQLSPDVYFGLSVAKGVLSRTTQNINHVGFINDLLNLKNNWTEDIQAKNNVYTDVVFGSIEKRGLKLQRQSLYKIDRSKVLNISTLDDYLNGIDDGSPSRSKSDICLAQTVSTRTCVISTQCLGMISAKDESKGYHKTHQILFVLMLQHNNCFASLRSDTSLRIVLKMLCSSVFMEMTIISHFEFPEFLHDLILEQMLFCSLAGFGEFLQESLIDTIFSWQSKSGCFKSFAPNAALCSDHMTGLAAGLLSLLL